MLGKRVTVIDAKSEVEIVGVVADSKYMSQREELKPLLYTFRVLLTGVHLMRSGEVQAHLPTLLGCVAEAPARLPDLIAVKAEREHGAADVDHARVRDDVERLHTLLDEAQDASALVRRAWANYRSPIDYGIVPLNLPKVAALIEAGMPARLYYVAYRNNAFDTHVQQSDLHQRLLTYTSDAVYGFMRDMERIGRADDVTMRAAAGFSARSCLPRACRATICIRRSIPAASSSS